MNATGFLAMPADVRETHRAHVLELLSTDDGASVIADRILESMEMAIHQQTKHLQGAAQERDRWMGFAQDRDQLLRHTATSILREMRDHALTRAALATHQAKAAAVAAYLEGLEEEQRTAGGPKTVMVDDLAEMLDKVSAMALTSLPPAPVVLVMTPDQRYRIATFQAGDGRTVAFPFIGWAVVAHGPGNGANVVEPLVMHGGQGVPSSVLAADQGLYLTSLR